MVLCKFRASFVSGPFSKINLFILHRKEVYANRPVEWKSQESHFRDLRGHSFWQNQTVSIMPWTFQISRTNGYSSWWTIWICRRIVRTFLRRVWDERSLAFVGLNFVYQFPAVELKHYKKNGAFKESFKELDFCSNSSAQKLHWSGTMPLE